MASKPVLRVSFVNNSGVDSDHVWIGLWEPFGPIDVANAKNSSEALRVLDDRETAHPKPRGNWYRLSEVDQGLDIRRFNGRIYICYRDGDDGGWATHGHGVEPAQALSDPSFYMRYDKIELTFAGSCSQDFATCCANLSAIDYWAIPMTLQPTLRDHPVGPAVQGIKDGSTARALFKALADLTGGQAVVPGKFDQHRFARVVGPSAALLPGVHYDSMDGYLKQLFAYGNGGSVAHLAGKFEGVREPDGEIPTKGPQAPQNYDLQAFIDKSQNIRLEGKADAVGKIVMEYDHDDLISLTGFYGGNARCKVNGPVKTVPGNDVFGWIAADLFCGLNIGAVGSKVIVTGSQDPVGKWKSSDWFKLLGPEKMFAALQPGSKTPAWNAWAGVLAAHSDAYNFAYTDRYAHVFASLNPSVADGLQVVLLPADVY